MQAGEDQAGEAARGPSGPEAPEAAPAFALTDDCGGRFAIDAATGFISVASEDILARERGRTFEARIRVAEKTGCYEMPVRLVITGMIPQVAGVEGFGEFTLEAAAQIAPPAATADPLPFSQARWVSFQAFAAAPPQHRLRGRLAHARYGAFSPQTPANLDCPSAALSAPAPAFNYPG